jgi:hypothetical protein
VSGFMDGRYRHFPTEILQDDPSKAYLLGMGPVREPTEEETARYAELAATDPDYKALVELSERARNGEKIPLPPRPEPLEPLPAEGEPIDGTVVEDEPAMAAAQRDATDLLGRWGASTSELTRIQAGDPE